MAMFGNRKTSFGAMEQPDPYGVSDAGPAIASPMPQISPAAPNVKTGGGINWAGVIADTLSGLAGQEPTFAPILLQQQQQDHQRQQGWEDWRRQYDYQVANPKAINNDTVNDYNFRVQTLGKKAADDWLASQGDPPVTVTLPGNRVYSGPRSGLAAALGAGQAKGGDPVSQAGIPSVSDQATYDAIQPGQQYRTPDGSIRVKGGAPSQGGATFR